MVDKDAVTKEPEKKKPLITELDTRQENSHIHIQSNIETEKNHMGKSYHNILENRASTKQRKVPKSLSDDFLW